jgi:hypothetical protein
LLLTVLVVARHRQLFVDMPVFEIRLGTPPAAT